MKQSDPDRSSRPFLFGARTRLLIGSVLTSVSHKVAQASGFRFQTGEEPTEQSPEEVVAIIYVNETDLDVVAQNVLKFRTRIR